MTHLIYISVIIPFFTSGCVGTRNNQAVPPSSLGGPAPSGRGPGPCFCRDLCFNGKRLLIRDSLWDVASGKELRHGEAQPRGMPQKFVMATRFSPDGKRVLIATAKNFGADLILEGQVELQDLVTGQRIARFSPHDGYVWDAQFSPDGSRILAVDTSNTVQIWEATSGQRLLALQGLWTPLFGTPAARYVSFSPDGRRVLVLSHDKVAIFDASTAKQICQLKATEDTGRPDFFVSTQYSPDGKLVLTEQCNGVTRIWDAATGQQTQVFAAVSTTGRFWPHALFTPEGRRVMSGSDNGIAVLWDLTSAKEIRRFQAPGLERGPVDEMIISNDGERLITVCSGIDPANSGVKNAVARKSGFLWNVETGQRIRQLPSQEQIVGFSPVGHTFITVKNGKPCALYDGTTGNLIRRYHEH